MSKSVLSSVCLFICKTKLKTLTEWAVSGPEGGIAITPVANTEYHPLLEGGGATGCGIDTKVELRKISEKYHFLIDQWHCINSLEICIKYNIRIYSLGVHHGYNVDNDKIWKDIINRMKNCIQVWKSRKLSYKGKTIIVKNLLLSYCGFEIEMKGIPDKFKKEIETLMWDFIWEGKVNQIKRDVCCLDIENGGMSMVNLDSYIDSRRIKFIYRIINEPIENWNAIGKYWLSRLDIKFNETFFICKCSNVSSLNLNRYPLFYQKSIQAWTKFLQCAQKVETKTDILHVRLFGNCNITFQNKPLIFSSFLRSNIKTIQDIWDENSKQFIDCDLLYSQLIDRRNCISEYSKIKKCIPKDYLKFLKNENNDIENKTKSRNKMKLLK